MHLEMNVYMTVTRKNVPPPVMTTDQKNGIDYVFLVILLLYLFVFLATLQCRAVQKEKTTDTSGTESSGHGSIYEYRDPNGPCAAVA